MAILALSCGGPTESADKDAGEAPKASAPEAGPFYHVVYFWLKRPEHTGDREQFIESLTTFIESSEHIRTRFVGRPAATDRPVIDNSYTFSLILSFDSKEAQDRYQVEPGHLKFIEESGELWEKVLVYDSEMLVE